MTPRPPVWLRGLLVGAAAVSYAILAHVSNAAPGASVLGAVLAVGPLFIAVLALAWHPRYRVAALAACAAAAGLMYVGWPVLTRHYPWLYLAQQAGTYAVLGAAFARTLTRAQVPLCTRWARMVHGPLAPRTQRYTRTVTLAWTVFFAAMSLALVLVYGLASLPVWSAFANFGAFPLVVAMFVGEYLVRGRVLPELERVSILEGVRAYLAHSRGPAPARRG